MRKFFVIAIIISLIYPFILTDGTASAQLSNLNLLAVSGQASDGSAKIAPQVELDMTSLQEGEQTTVIVTLVDQADLSLIPGASRAARQQGVIRALQAMARSSQKQILAYLEDQAALGNVSQMDTFWVFNGLSVTATQEVIQELATWGDVAKITPDEIQIEPVSAMALNPPETNLSVIQAPALWDLGFFGQGVVVANMDSGVDFNHPDLSTRWRGGSNSWFDPYGQHPTTPTDLSGHGTQTMGVMVGGESGGTTIGVAPGAQWIAVKIFNDQGGSTASAIHQGYQWLLDPDGNPGSADAPYVVNNSWTFAYPGCDLEFELDIVSLRAAGILPVFAGGNGGPSTDTSYSPANNPSAFAVGAINNTDLIYAYSSRGPSACGESSAVFPEIAAPGVSIHTTDLYGSYTDATGTSLAAPHVAGGLALLLSAFPNLTDSEQETASINSAVDLGALGPDNVFGYGRFNLLAAYQWLDNPPPTPTPDPNLNLALNKTVTFSSSQDSSHNGEMSVDGEMGTFWKTLRAKGKNKLPTEWITIDLGSSSTIGLVVLEWDNNYATSYDIQVSEDSHTWTNVYSTTSGDGGNDTISLSPATARYVKMESSAWSSGSLRNWLREFEIYAGSGNPLPTATPTPTSTPTPTPTPTSTPTPTPTPVSGGSMHVGEFVKTSTLGNRNRWNATVTTYVHDQDENLVIGATLTGLWSGGASGSGTCETDASGGCSLSKNNLKGNVDSVTFTVVSITHASLEYMSSENHDVGGGSIDGNSIMVTKP